ncbi:hypothetical protein ASG87_02220 [Frateuria sp. Soil773]|nr:hypothetical protein ASG87_02220 [Frateuria sp. Soil773]
MAALLGCAPLPALALPAVADAAAADTYRQSRDDAWWTGPMMANSAETLPPGHFLAEPYLYDVRSAHADGFGSRTYLLYGLAERLTVGVIPVFGYNRPDGAPGSRGAGMGDFTVQAQYRLTEFQEDGWLPTTAVMLQETLPTGHYDRLVRPADGMGSGAYGTTLGFNAQTYLWMPNGRILRLRLNLSASRSGRARVRGASVYGTDDGFRGSARPGNAYGIDASVEYSLTRRWVLAMDFLYNRNGSTRVTGRARAGLPHDLRMESGRSDAYGIAPAVEYSWTPNVGVLLGTRVIFGGHRTPSSVTPAIAINYVH